MAYRIFLVEDYFPLRIVLRELLEREPDMRVCGQANSGEEALARLESITADIVVSDLTLVQMSGIDLAAALQHRQPDLPLVILSGHHDRGFAEAALAAGARGYVIKEDPTVVIEAIRTVIGGGVYVSRELRPVSGS